MGGDSFQQFIPIFYRTLIVSKLICIFYFLFIFFCQWQTLEMVRSAALRLCLEVPLYAPNVQILVEGEEFSSHYLAEERARCRIERISRSPSPPVLPKWLLAEPYSRMGQFATLFQSVAQSTPVALLHTFSRYLFTSHGSLQVCPYLPDIRKMFGRPFPVLRPPVAERLANIVAFLYVFTKRISRATFHIPSIRVNHAGRPSW